MSRPFLASLFVLVGCMQLVRGDEPPALTQINNGMQKFVDDHEVAGIVTLVASPDAVLHLGAVGHASTESGAPLKTDAMFGVMSMTKPVTGTAFMILVDEGKVAVEDPVEKYLPAFKNAKTRDGAPVKGLTIRHLLTHTSGLNGDQGVHDSLEATAASLAKRSFAFQPGEKWEYSPSLNVVGRIIEIVSGKSYEDFLAERIFKPLGMKDATFHPSPEQRERLVELYERTDDGQLKPTTRWGDVGEPGCVPNPSGGIFATAADMARFYQMMLNGGELDGQRILSAQAVKQMTTVQSGDVVTGFTPGNGWGLGWCVVRKPEGVTESLAPGSFGHGGAYGTQGWVDPVNHQIYVLMVQRSNLPNSDASDIRREFQRLGAESSK